MRTFAVDIGGTKFSLAAFQGDQLLLRETRLTNRGGGPQWMFSQITEIYSAWRERESFQPDCCGIGFGGPVDFPSQTVTLSTHVEGWSGYPLAQNIAALVDSPTVMDNDANVGALGEAVYGAGRQLPFVLYLTVSTGIGGGIVLNESIYRGADSFAGEIGHINIVPDGPACLCGSNGCLERMCCGLWLQRDYGRSAEELMADPEFVRGYVVYLARGLKAALMLLNPSCLIIGGGISKAGNKLFDPLRSELNRQMTAWSLARRNVVPAQLGDNSVLYGALALAQTVAPKVNKI